MLWKKMYTDELRIDIIYYTFFYSVCNKTLRVFKVYRMKKKYFKYNTK